MSLASFGGTFMSAAMVYMIVAAQVYMGFPPFYRSMDWGLPWRIFEDQSELERDIKLMLPFAFAIMALFVLFIFIQSPIFFLIIGAVSIASGLLLRRRLFRISGGTLPWVTSVWLVPWPINVWLLRWPMLVFDVWTLTFSLAFGALTLL